MTAPASDFETALAAWREALGADNVRPENPDSPTQGLRTFGVAARVLATLLPGSADAVSAALAIASRHGIGVHPVSRGANWGMGSRAPGTDGGVVLDLSRMTAISGFDARNGRVHVEPGVTFIQLFEFLGAQDCDYFLPTIGGPVKASVLANALDRGDAVFCDRWHAFSDFEVILADGTRLETGFGRESPLAGGGIPPAGAIVEGLFSQSNLGIVVGGWLQLEPVPANLTGWMLHVGKRENLVPFIERWRTLQRQGTIPDRSLTLWNGVKLMGRSAQRKDYAEADIEKAQLDGWYCAGFVTGETPAILDARNQLLNTGLAGTVEGGEAVTLRAEGQWAEGGEEVLATPNEVNLHTVYWRHPALPALADMDPDRDGCGMLWACLAMPFEGEAILDFSVWCHARLKAAGMDFNIGLEAASFRTALSYVTLCYERSPEADAAALDAYADILEYALDKGFAPYRLANGAPLPARMRETGRNGLLQRIRAVIDPQGIVSEGRAGVYV